MDALIPIGLRNCPELLSQQALAAWRSVKK
jgi:hypothetical protein